MHVSHMHASALSGADLRTMKGILPSLSSFIAILRGSDSLPTLMSTGAFMLTCVREAGVTDVDGETQAGARVG